MEDDGLGMERRWRRRKEWIHSTLTAEASSRDVIAAAAATFTHSENLIGPYRRSGRGPATESLRPAADLKPDLTAPGAEIVIARWRPPKRPTDVPSVSELASGTSYASPAVAGAIALMLSHDPTLTQNDIRTMLRATASPWVAKVQIAFKKREVDEQNISGKGLLNIEAALNRVKTRVGP